MSYLNSVNCINPVYEMAARILRLGSSVSLGVVVTAALLLVMCSLIATEFKQNETTPIRIADIALSKDRTIESLPEPAPIKPIEPTAEPSLPEFRPGSENAEGIELVIAPPTIGGPINLDPGASNGPALATLRVAPRYPSAALRRGIEGYVDLLFDVAASGKTENIRVLDAQPKGYFEKASIKTLAKWKYKPAMDDGVPIPQRNQTTRIVYELDQ